MKKWSPTDRAELEALTVIGVLEWLEPENVERFLEIARQRNVSLFKLTVTALRRWFDRPGRRSNRSRKPKHFFVSAGWKVSSNIEGGHL